MLIFFSPYLWYKSLAIIPIFCLFCNIVVCDVGDGLLMQMDAVEVLLEECMCYGLVIMLCFSLPGNRPYIAEATCLDWSLCFVFLFQKIDFL
jgi:hypothetical protein